MALFFAVGLCTFAVLTECADVTWTSEELNIASVTTLSKQTTQNSIATTIIIPDDGHDYDLSFSVVIGTSGNQVPTCTVTFGSTPLDATGWTPNVWDTASQGRAIPVTMEIGNIQGNPECSFSQVQVRGTLLHTTAEPRQQPTDLPTKSPTQPPATTTIATTTASSTPAPTTAAPITAPPTTASMTSVPTSTASSSTTASSSSTTASTTAASSSTAASHSDTSQTLAESTAGTTTTDLVVEGEQEDQEVEGEQEQEDEDEDEDGRIVSEVQNSDSNVPYMQIIVGILGGIFCLIAIGIALALKRARADFSKDDYDGDEEKQLAPAPGSSSFHPKYTHSTDTNVVANHQHQHQHHAAMPSHLSPQSSMIVPGEAVQGDDDDHRMPAMLEMQLMNPSTSMTAPQIEGEQVMPGNETAGHGNARKQKHANTQPGHLQMNDNAMSSDFIDRDHEEMAMINRVLSENDRVLLQKQRQKHAGIDDEDSKMMQDIEQELDGYHTETRLSVPSMMTLPHRSSMSTRGAHATPGMPAGPTASKSKSKSKSKTKGGSAPDGPSLLGMGSTSFVVAADDSDDEHELEKMLHEVNNE